MKTETRPYETIIADLQKELKIGHINTAEYVIAAAMLEIAHQLMRLNKNLSGLPGALAHFAPEAASKPVKN